MTDYVIYRTRTDELHIPGVRQLIPITEVTAESVRAAIDLYRASRRARKLQPGEQIIAVEARRAPWRDRNEIAHPLGV